MSGDRAGEAVTGWIPSMASERKPTWEKSSAELVALFTELVPKDPEVTQKKMFGWPCCFVNGNLFAGLHKESMIFRLSDADRLAFLRLDGAADFEPMLGRKMKGYTTLRNPMRRDRNVGRTCDETYAVAAAQGKSQASWEEWKKGCLT